MASLIPGYKYDIFISYRQKDNKYDGWVTEFVDNLKRELDSMFKEEVSVYFDINPSDYLLETYDVDASLKDKLKCLVIIPIVSRTYCDPKAFAWEYEFKAFVEQASKDEFGLQVKVPGGNFANRVLPVRIHDLESADVKLFESTIGGVLRSIDFIYKETGVNRQLRARDDDIIKSPSQVLYRDQINKVALASRDIIKGMITSQKPAGKEEESIEKSKSKNGKELSEKPVDEKIEKVESITADGEDLKSGPEKEKKKPFIITRKFIFPLFLFLITTSGAFFLINYISNVKWAKDEALKTISKLSADQDYVPAFNLARKAKKYNSKDSVLNELLSEVSSRVTILTDPPGAYIYLKEYSDTSGNLVKVGRTPVDSLQLPLSTFYRFMIEKAGYDTVYGATLTNLDTLSRKIFITGEIPEGMVYVDGYWDELKHTWEEKLGFFLDKYEVTNKQYKEFVDHGGYRNRDYWKHEFIKEGKKLSWDEAMAGFVDLTGMPGPSNWEAGDYPEGQDNYPVGGVSWYEAAAFAEYAGKVLPTGNHWRSGAGLYWDYIRITFGPEIYPFSNIQSKGPLPVGMKKGISCFGAYDMAGSVREWCSNESSQGRIICGAGWDDANYVFEYFSQLPPYNRFHLNGFRCAKYIDKEKIPETAFRFIELSVKEQRDYYRELIVRDHVYQVYKNQFSYDSTAINPIIEYRNHDKDDYILEKVTIITPYGKERMDTYVFLPGNSSPPFQTIIFFPGGSAVRDKDPLQYAPGFFEFILKSGRAVVFPVYYGTYYRNDGQGSKINARKTHLYTENLIKWVKDFKRTIEYLETRNDIDTSKLGYYGYSWGGRMGAIIPAVEDRLSLSILILAGFPGSKPYPEADELNYITRVKVPTLIMSGKYDSDFRLDEQVIPFYKLLGTPEADKKLTVFESSHYISPQNRIKEIIPWLDKYFGPPNYLEKE